MTEREYRGGIRERFLDTVKTFSDETEISLWRIAKVAGITNGWFDAMWLGRKPLTVDVMTLLSQALDKLADESLTKKSHPRKSSTWHRARPSVSTHGKETLDDVDHEFFKDLESWRKNLKKATHKNRST